MLYRFKHLSYTFFFNKIIFWLSGSLYIQGVVSSIKTLFVFGGFA